MECNPPSTPKTVPPRMSRMAIMGDGVLGLIGEITTVKIVLPYLHLCKMSLFAMMSSCIVLLASRRSLAEEFPCQSFPQSTTTCAPTLLYWESAFFKSTQHSINSTIECHRVSRDSCENRFLRKPSRSWELRNAGGRRGPAW